MSELDAIEATARPATHASLVAELTDLGLRRGSIVMVHSSLSRLGFVIGGAQTVVAALLDVVGDEGTLVMPSHSGQLSDPATWSNPPVPEAWWQTIREEMPSFDPDLTPTRAMGAVVECFRHVTGVRRSNHPAVSAVAVGPEAAHVLDGHELADGLGESSPQARLYELGGQILLLGVTHANNTSLHLAEHRVRPHPPMTEAWAPVTVGGRRRWVSYPALDEDTADFDRLGDDFAVSGAELQGSVGNGVGRLMRSQDIVDYAVTWMRTNRKPSSDPATDPATDLATHPAATPPQLK
jgi:aminoglycoside 3-N-acetyltransferase